MGKCTLVLIFYNCLFGLLVLFFRIRGMQMIYQLIQIYLQIGVFFTQTILCAVAWIIRIQIVLFLPFVRYAISVGVGWGRFGFIFGPASYIYRLVNHSVGASMRPIHKCNSLCGFLLRFVGLRLAAVRSSGKLQYIFIGFLCRLQ